MKALLTAASILILGGCSLAEVKENVEEFKETTGITTIYIHGHYQNGNTTVTY